VVTAINYQAVFRASPGATTLLSPSLDIVDANDDFLAVVGRELEDVLGRNVFAAFPHNPSEPHEVPATLRASLERVLATGERETMDLMRYDIEVPGKPGVFEERYWALVNTPIRAANGQIVLIESCAEDVTFAVRDIQKAQAISG
jgi:PAS domain S-box-containing protein